MSALSGPISLLALLLTTGLLTRMLHPRTRVAGWMIAGILLSCLIVLPTYLLSALTRLGDIGLRMAIDLGLLALTLGVAAAHATLRHRVFRPIALPRDIEARIAATPRGTFLVSLLLLLGITVTLVSVANLLIIACLEPSTPDALQYHLARIAYYLQQGHLGYYPASYWAQVIYPKIATCLQLYALLVSDRSATMTQLVQLVAYFYSMLGLYGICRQLGYRRQVSALAGLLFGVLIICLLEAATAQNDLILTAYVGATLYGVMAYRTWGERRYLVITAIALALAVGVKATFLLVLPSIVLVAGTVLITRGWPAPPITVRHGAVAVLALLLGLLFIDLPAGYGENLRRFGDPFGPASVRAEFTNERASVMDIAQHAGLNALRYAIDALVVEGAEPLPYARDMQDCLTEGPRWLLDALGAPLTSSAGARAAFPFSYEKTVRADATLSGLGALGFLLVWPGVLLAICGGIRAPGARMLAVATGLYVVVLCVLIPYDPFHGRFLVTAAIFALPPVAAWVGTCRGSLGRIYFGAALLVGCLLALLAGYFRAGTNFLPITIAGRAYPSVFTQGRAELIMRDYPSLLVHNFELIVPPDAVVALDTQHIAPEFIFFGERLTRRVIPLRPCIGPRRPMPPEAQYLVYDATSPDYQSDGHLLTEPTYPVGLLYVRKLPGQP